MSYRPVNDKTLAGINHTNSIVNDTVSSRERAVVKRGIYENPGSKEKLLLYIQQELGITESAAKALLSEYRDTFE